MARLKKNTGGYGLQTHLYFGYLLRCLLIVYGVHHDKTNALKYTDVDYHVFTDGAKEVVNGGSPFDRHTYRYTPFLAFFMIPNIKLHFLFGKFLFGILDCLVARLVYSLLKRDGCVESVCLKGAFLWLYNPMVIAMSTRGSSDSIQAVLTLILLYCLKLRLPLLSGLVLGTAVHFKLYPVIYTLPIYISFTAKLESFSFVKKIWPNIYKIKFLVGCFLSFFLLTGLAFALYGEQYVEEAFLYHLSRVDTRHNFSIFFYLLYLSSEHPIPFLFLATFMPQFIICLALGYKYGTYSNLPFALFTQTFAFVVFNKVLTSQYFLWFLVYLPVVYPRIGLSPFKAFFLFTLWMAAQASWLLPAYLLEFRGNNAFLPIWLESIAFFCCNVGVLLALVSGYDSRNTT